MLNRESTLSMPPSSPTRRSFTGVKEALAPKPVPVSEMLHLNPLEKFIKYRIVPMKLILNVAIFALLLAYTFIYHVPRNAFEANTRFGLASLFFDVADNTDASLQTDLTSIDDFLAFVDDAVAAYYTAPEESAGVYMHYVYGPFNATPIAPLMVVRFRDASLRTVEHRSALTAGNPRGPFANISALATGLSEDCTPLEDVAGNAYIPCRNSTMADFFDSLHSVEISCSLRSVRIDPGATAATIALWKINFSFVLSAHNSIITMRARLRTTETHRAESLPVILCLVLVPLALWDFILRLRFFHQYHIYVSSFLPAWLVPTLKASRRNRLELQRWEMRRAGRGWTFFAMVADVAVVGFCVLAFADAFSFYSNTGIRIWTTLLLGIATMFECLLMISYLQTTPRFYVLMRSLSTALPHLGLYLVGVLPIFVGYALCGFAVFSGFSDFFKTLPASMITLFCTQQGDNLIDFIIAVDDADFFPIRVFSRLYFASFLMLFICNILNIALAIVQDSYAHVKSVYEVCRFDQEKTEQRLSGGKYYAEYYSRNSVPEKPMQRSEMKTIIQRIHKALPSSAKKS